MAEDVILPLGGVPGRELDRLRQTVVDIRFQNGFVNNVSINTSSQWLVRLNHNYYYGVR